MALEFGSQDAVKPHHTIPTLVWNILGSAALGFSSFVLTSNLAGMVRTLVIHSMDKHAWEWLSKEAILPYMLLLVVLPLTVIIPAGRRVLSHDVMGRLQLLAVLGAPAALMLVIMAH